MFPYGFDNGDGEVGAAEGMKNGAAVYYDTSFANPAVKIPFDTGSEIGVPFVSTSGAHLGVGRGGVLPCPNF